MELKNSYLNMLHDTEIRLINSNFKNFYFDVTVFETIMNDKLCYMYEHLVRSEYNSVLKITFSECGFLPKMINFENPHAYICNLPKVIMDSSETSYVAHNFVLLYFGVSALQEFVRLNFCGPRKDVYVYDVISQLSEWKIDFSESIKYLSIDSESINLNVLYPDLLYFSYFVLSSIDSDLCYTQKWWLLRCIFLHQYILSEKNELLHKTLVSLIKDIYQEEWINEKIYAFKKLIFAVECCHIFLFYGEVNLARRYIIDAQSITGLEIELSGALGKRTQYQKNAVAQLFVKLKRNECNFVGTLPEKNTPVPVDLSLQDDVLLNKISFIDKNEDIIENLYAEEQAVLLGYCCLIRKSESSDELLLEEITSYINCLLSQPQVWVIYLKSLIMRCMIEKKNSRRIERAVMQMESIVEAVKKDLPPFSERQKYYFCTSFPAFWVLQQELADLLLTIGCTKSALDIYDKLQLWENIVDCYIRLRRTSSAEKLIKTQLEKEETPLLWCLLGDITEDIEHYLKAWELSNHRSARAQRSLGYHYYKKKEYKECIPFFLSSLEVSHLQPQVWFSVGHAATQIEDFELAARAYRQVVMFDEDNFEAWNNLANAYIKTKQKVRAWRSLQEALKCNYEEWRVWENFLLVSTDVGAFEDALRAWHRLLDIKGKHNDSLLLEILVNAIKKDLTDINGIPSARLKKKALELLGRITSVITNEPKIWELYSSLTNSIDDSAKDKEIVEKAVIYQQKAVRCYNQREQWEKNYNSCKEVLLSSIKLAEINVAYMKLLDETLQNSQKVSVKLNLQTVVTRVSKFIDNYSDDEKEDLSETLELLKQLLCEISSI